MRIIIFREKIEEKDRKMMHVCVMKNPIHKKDKVDIFVFDEKTKMMEKMRVKKKVEGIKKK
jgi:hypothetical protein